MPTITITAGTTQAARVSHAVGVRFSLGHDASIAEIQTVLANLLKAWVKEVEQNEASTSVLDIT